MTERTCKACGKTKPLSQFSRKLKGWQPKCKTCCSAESKAYHAANAKRVKARRVAYYQENRAVLLEKQKAYYADNREARLLYAERWRAANPEYATELYQANASKQRAASRDWRKANPDRRRVQEIARRAVSRRIPAWADRAAMAAIYRYARIMRDLGIDCHVDHEVPLRGKTVNGLHVHTNLTVLPAEVNLRKGAKLL